MTNANQRGSAADRRSRKQYLMDTYRADVHLHIDDTGETTQMPYPARMCDTCVPLARCNIRPSCSPCATITGNELKARLRASA